LRDYQKIYAKKSYSLFAFPHFVKIWFLWICLNNDDWLMRRYLFFYFEQDYLHYTLGTLLDCTIICHYRNSWNVLLPRSWFMVSFHLCCLSFQDVFACNVLVFSKPVAQLINLYFFIFQCAIFVHIWYLL
jgi:hypothetical protein